MSTSTLNEIIESWGGLIQTGPFGSQLHQHDYSEQGIPVVMPKDIRNGRVDESGIARIPEGKASQLSRHFLKAGSVVFPRRGEISKCAYIDEEQAGFLCGTGCIKIEPPEEKLRSKFLFYFLGLRQSVEWLERNAVGTTMLNLNTKILGGLKVPLFAHKKQDDIVEILSVYDDLIENNRRRIQLLEQAARLLYKEWFIHLRFPGHEHTQIIDGVPEGWARREINDLTSKIGSGATPRGGAAAYQATGITLVRSQNIYDFKFVDNGLAYIDDLQAKKLANVTVEERDILLNITGASVGRCCIIPIRHLPARVNQHVMIIRVKPSICGQYYILHSINSHRNKEQLLNIARAGGATREALTKDVVGRLSVIIPPVSLLNEFEQRATLLSDQCHLLDAQNVQLAKARDLLLPKLMNGEVAV